MCEIKSGNHSQWCSLFSLYNKYLNMILLYTGVCVSLLEIYNSHPSILLHNPKFDASVHNKADNSLQKLHNLSYLRVNFFIFYYIEKGGILQAICTKSTIYISFSIESFTVAIVKYTYIFRSFFVFQILLLPNISNYVSGNSLNATANE